MVAAGAPFTSWLIRQAAGLPPDASDDWQDGTTMLRYDAAIFGRGDSDSWR